MNKFLKTVISCSAIIFIIIFLYVTPSHAFKLGKIKLQEGTYTGQLFYKHKQLNGTKVANVTLVVSDKLISGFVPISDEVIDPILFSSSNLINTSSKFYELKSRFKARDDSNLEFKLIFKGKTIAKGDAHYVKREISESSVLKGVYVTDKYRLPYVNVASDGSALVLLRGLGIIGYYGIIDNNGNIMNISNSDTGLTLTKVNENIYELKIIEDINDIETIELKRS